MDRRTLTDEQRKKLNAENKKKRDEFRPYIERLQNDGYKLHWFTRYHVRINNRLDIYPTSRRFHDRETGERGTITYSVEKFVGDRLGKLIRIPDVDLPWQLH